VDAGDAHPLRTIGRQIFQRPSARQRLLVLRNLITLGQIGIEIVLSSENRRLVDVAVQSQPGTNGQIDRRSIQDRQRPWKAETNRTDVRVGWRAKCRTAAAEDLGGGQELRVNLETDDGLKRHTEP
jgi:hypothetical protein